MSTRPAAMEPVIFRPQTICCGDCPKYEEEARRDSFGGDLAWVRYKPWTRAQRPGTFEADYRSGLLARALPNLELIEFGNACLDSGETSSRCHDELENAILGGNDG